MATKKQRKKTTRSRTNGASNRRKTSRKPRKANGKSTRSKSTKRSATTKRTGRKKASTKKHLAGVNEKEQRQYEQIKEKAQKSGRYGKRAKEVAARTVMKQHREKGHKRGR